MEIAQVGTCGEVEWQQNSLMDRLRANLLYFNIYLCDRVEVIRKAKLKDIQACEWRVTKRNTDEPVGTKCLSSCFVAFATSPRVHIWLWMFPYTQRDGSNIKTPRAAKGHDGVGESPTQAEGF